MNEKTEVMVEKKIAKAFDKGSNQIYNKMLYKTYSNLETLRLTNMGISTIAVVGAWNFSMHKNAYDKIVSVGKNLSVKLTELANEAGMMWDTFAWKDSVKMVMGRNEVTKHFEKFHFERPTKSLRIKDEKGNRKELLNIHDR